VPSEFVFDSSDTLTVEVTEVATSYFSTAANVRTGGAFTLTIPVFLDRYAPSAKLESVVFNLYNTVGATGTKAVPACQ